MDQALRIERVVLLGFVTLLGATASLATAIAGLAVSAGAALVVCAIAAILGVVGAVPPAGRWAALFAVGFGVSWALSSVAAYVVPIPSGALLILRLAGVAPIVYYAIADGVSVKESLVSWAQFGVLMIGIGVVREFFGRGTLFGFLPFGSFTIPAEFFGSPIGAFLVLATVVLGARIIVGIIGQPEVGDE
ncbi:MAG: hypothetical protein EA426_20490 [Spirochaetaceae bacterium]|nr:MAG: hypothetical protein EA426_20490 [Spirochaetaceae bacterium]